MKIFFRNLINIFNRRCAACGRKIGFFEKHLFIPAKKIMRVCGPCIAGKDLKFHDEEGNLIAIYEFKEDSWIEKIVKEK